MSHKIFRWFASLFLALAVTATNLGTQPAGAVGPWYVTTTGDDINDCLGPGTACATINAALGKASSGDIINVALGIYIGTGNEVVLLDKDIILSGGWDDAFTTQSGTSTIDAEGARRGITVNNGLTAVVERFTIQHGEVNAAIGNGDGILNAGVLTLDRVHIRGNGTIDGGGGILNRPTGILTLNNSAVTGNGSTQTCIGGIFNDQGTVTINNSTVSGNASSTRFCAPIAGIANHTGPLTLNNVTVSNNIGGGIWSFPAGVATLQNTLVAGNTANGSPYDCNTGDVINSIGYNLIGVAPCTVNSTTGDQIGTLDSPINAQLGTLTGSPAYHPLNSGSPAINAGNPAGCMGSTGVLSTDQRGAPRVGICDIGAYEFAAAGSPASVVAIDGTPQRTPPFATFDTPFRVSVFDNVGTPVDNVTVTFSAPASGVSGTFFDSGTNTTTAVTNRDGIATATNFTANGELGSYTVTATVVGVATPAIFQLTHFGWYVAVGGNDSNDCQNPASACASINAVFAKPDFTSGDTILVSAGTYTGTGDEVILLEQSTQLLGGWNSVFTAQNGTSLIDGEHLRKGMRVSSGVTAVVEQFAIQNGSAIQGAGISLTGGGIYNGGTLSLKNVTLSGNAAQSGGGIANGGGVSNSIGNLTLDNTWIHDNTARGAGGGIYNSFGTLTVNNSTINNNISNDAGGGIMVDCCSASVGGTAIFNNSTISGNLAHRGGGFLNAGSLTINNSTISANTSEGGFSGGGIDNGYGGTVTLKNSILAGNTALPTGRDCNGSIGSSGYNLLGDDSNCNLAVTTGDMTNLDPFLGSLQDNGGAALTHALLPQSPAIDAGNTDGCKDQDGDLLTTDQRGITRPQGIGCDIGSYEYTFTTPGPATSLAILSGSGQLSQLNMVFSKPLRVVALDSQGNRVSGVTVTFTAPGSGASGTFADTGTNSTTIDTNAGGVATTSVFTANDQAGAYTVSASAPGLGSVNFNLEQFARPANDNFASAEAITTLPFNSSVDIAYATNEPDEQQFCYFMDKTVWYSFTPTETTTVRANTQGSAVNGALNIYRASGPGISGLQFLTCSGPTDSSTFSAEANQTYYVQAGSAEVGIIQINLEQIPPVANDDFDNAITVGALPFSDTRDTSTATSASDDPVDCHNNGSVWYQFTPPSDITIMANTFGSDYDTTLAVFTGSRGALELVPGGCNDDFSGLQSRVVFNAIGGTTYYFLLGFCCGNGASGGGNLIFSVEEYFPAPPQAGFFFSPTEPTTFDTIQFYDNSFDPESIGIQTWEWDFGDGTPLGTDPFPTHMYAADGDYPVTLTVRTFDGRSASITQTVQVRTQSAVTIDIKPGNKHNRIMIESRSSASVQVAILSTADFNAPAQVDKNSLTFGATGDENSLRRRSLIGTPDCRVRDVNRDRIKDLVCSFLIGKTGFKLGDSVGILKGQTVDGTLLEGRDSVVITTPSYPSNPSYP